jgi:ATP-dependent helicase/nuclease subunit A
VPLSHRAQLAIYCEILRPLYPAKSFECVLVYTESAQVVTLPAELLSRSLAELKTK